MIIFRVATGRAASKDLKGNPTTTNMSTGLDFNPTSTPGDNSTIGPYDGDRKKQSLRSRSQGLSSRGTEMREQSDQNRSFV